jgi:MSHA pilin protein MshD
MMEEIMTKRWDENTPMGGGPLNTNESTRGTTTPVGSLGEDGAETRTDYNDVDDYNDLNEPVTGNFHDQNGNPFSLPGYTRKVSVCYIPSGTPSIDQNPASCSATTTDTKRVVVTITSPLNETFYFVAVACNI